MAIDVASGSGIPGKTRNIPRTPLQKYGEHTKTKTGNTQASGQNSGCTDRQTTEKTDPNTRYKSWKNVHTEKKGPWGYKQEDQAFLTFPTRAVYPKSWTHNSRNHMYTTRQRAERGRINKKQNFNPFAGFRVLSRLQPTNAYTFTIAHNITHII